MRRRNIAAYIAIATIAIGAVSIAQAQAYTWPAEPTRESFKIWPGASPNPVPTNGPEADTTTAKDNLIAGKPLVRLGNVAEPTVTIYKPTAKNTGAAPGPAVVVFPGGGYQILAIDLEGTEVCQWLNQAGVTCALLKYRVPNTGPYPKSAAALQDAQRAVSLIRASASKWQIDPNRIGVLGFSAGGHLAVALSTHYDKRLYDPIDPVDNISCRPDFAVVVYPGYLADEKESFLDKLDIHPTAQTPPAFIVQAEDDPVHVENSTAYFLALKTAKVPAELHLYAEGGHGYGLRPQAKWPVTTWPQSVETWLHTIHILPGK